MVQLYRVLMQEQQMAVPQHFQLYHLLVVAEVVQDTMVQIQDTKMVNLEVQEEVVVEKQLLLQEVVVVETNPLFHLHKVIMVQVWLVLTVVVEVVEQPLQELI